MYAPLLVVVIYQHYRGTTDHNDMFSHMLILAALRHFVGQLCITLSRWPYLVGNHEIQKKGITFEAVDHSTSW